MADGQTGQKSVWMPLKVAAAKLNRSTARVRQYVHDGKLGAEGTAWRRNEMGNLEVHEDAVANFTPPERGNARASGVSVNTQLRHVNATIKLVQKYMKESDNRRITLMALTTLANALDERKRKEEAGISSTQKAAPAAPEASVSEPELTVAESEDEDEELDELELEEGEEDESEEDFDEELINL